MKSFVATGLLLLTQIANAQNSLHAHEHGTATLSIAYEKNQAEINLEAPADSIVGFERKAKNDKEKALIKKAETTWNSILKDIVILPESSKCTTSEITFEFIVEGKHAEVEAKAVVKCEKDITGPVTVNFIKHYPKAKKLKLEVVGAKSTNVTVKEKSYKVEL